MLEQILTVLDARAPLREAQAAPLPFLAKDYRGHLACPNQGTRRFTLSDQMGIQPSTDCVYVADRGDNRLIRKVVPNATLTSGTVRTVVGATQASTKAIALEGLPGQLNLAWGLALWTQSPATLIVTDQLDNSIIRVDLP